MRPQPPRVPREARTVGEGRLGGHVEKGEHGSPVVYASTFKRQDQAEDSQGTDEEIPFLKEYTVFNVEQCEGLTTARS